MAEIKTLARPYADAVFELAEAGDALAQWSEALTALAAIVVNEDVAALMGNPDIDEQRLVDAIIEIAGDDFFDAASNLVRLLAENERLPIAPAIAEQFEAQRAAAENRVDVSVTSAAQMSEEQQRSLGRSLEKRLGRDVRLTFEQDESVIGGAIIRAGDLVIDNSLSAQLERMRHSLAG